MPDNPFLEALRRATSGDVGPKPPTPSPGPFGAPLAPPPPPPPPSGSFRNPASGLPDLVRGWFDNPDRPKLVDLAKLFTRVPMRGGFYERLANDQLTDEDQQKATEAIGGPITPQLREDILGQMIGGIADGLGKMGQIAPNPQNWLMQRGMNAAGNIAGNFQQGGLGQVVQSGIPGLGGAPPTLPGAPPPPPGGAGQGTGDVALGQTLAPTGGRGDIPLGGSAADITPRVDAQGNPLPANPQATVGRRMLQGGMTAERDANNIWYLKTPDGKVLGRLGSDGVWHFTADPTDDNLQAAAQSGMFDQSELLKLRTDYSKITQDARDNEWKSLDRDYQAKKDEIELKLKAGELDLGRAKQQLEEAKFGVDKEKVAVDIAAAKADLAMKPLVEQEYRTRIAQSQMTMQMEQMKFPLELQQLQENILEAQSVRQERERQAARQTAGDSFMAQMMPGLLSAMGGKGSAAYAGAKLGQAPEGQPNPMDMEGAPPQGSPFEAAAAGQPAGEAPTGPPPLFASLAQGAGVSPADPAAQMAWSAMQQIFAGGAEQGTATPPAQAAPANQVQQAAQPLVPEQPQPTETA